MGRIHLFEIEDQAWCPKFIRETTTDFLFALYKLFDLYQPAYEKISQVLNKTKTQAIIDCCSGSGGPIQKLREYLDNTQTTPITITLTDKYPNVRVFKKLESLYPKKIIGHINSINASQLPASMSGMRTFFSSFHHFSPDNALKILQNAVDNQAPIGIFECTQRHPADFIRTLLSPILMPLIVPFAGRLNWQKFLGTYIIPITPFTNMWDYFVSNLRTYSPKELQAMVNKLDAPHYTWEIGKLWSNKAKSHITYLIGHKK